MVIQNGNIGHSLMKRVSWSRTFASTGDQLQGIDFQHIKTLTKKAAKKPRNKNTNSHVNSSRSRESLIPTTFTISPKNIKQELIDIDKINVSGSSKPPELKFNLNKILYEPVVLHKLYDKRSGVYNYDRVLTKLPPSLLDRSSSKSSKKCDKGIKIEKEEAVAPSFVTPHKDKNLLKVASIFNKKYISSTSSMTSVLSQLHYLISNFRKLNISNSSISKNFSQKNCNFTRGAHFPASIILRKKSNGIKSIDSDRSLDREMVLSILGHSLEDFLTVKDDKDSKTADHYHYSQIDNFIIRSQLDAYDPKLPGSGIFDLKTRAVVSIRHDLPYVEKNNNFTGYEISNVFGQFESLEREYFEVIRSTLLKYSLQARMGFMDGIFLAYHNISKIFGFQYLPLEEIDYIIHSAFSRKFGDILGDRDALLKNIYGQEEYIINHERNERKIATTLADAEFKISIVAFNKILTQVEQAIEQKVKDWKMIKIMMHTENTKKILPNGQHITLPILNIIALPLPDEYEDIPLVSSKKIDDLETIEKQMCEIRDKNKKLLRGKQEEENVVGFQLILSHKQRHHPNSQKFPEFMSRMKNQLSKGDREFILGQLNKQYYPKNNHFHTPNFFDPTDIDEWSVHGTFESIKDSNKTVSLYHKYLNVKLEALQFQSVVKETDATSKNAQILQSIRNLRFGISSEKRKKLGEKEPSEFQSILRAYSMKGQMENE